MKRLESEIVRRLDRLLSQYFYDYDININENSNHVLTVNIDTDLDSLSRKEINILVNHLTNLVNDYNVYDAMSEVIEYDDGLQFKIYL